MSFHHNNNAFANPFNNVAPITTAPSLTKRRCDSMEEDNSSLHSQEDHNSGSNKRIKSSHQVTAGGFCYGGPAPSSFQTPPPPRQQYHHHHHHQEEAPQYREPIQFVTSTESAFFTYGVGQQSASSVFRRQP